MIESYLLAGRKDYVAGETGPFGMSITDACIGWADTVRVLERLAKATSSRHTVARYQQEREWPSGCQQS
jgi:3-deoxy-7-phosphoheptulonate synthase